MAVFGGAFVVTSCAPSLVTRAVESHVIEQARRAGTIDPDLVVRRRVGSLPERGQEYAVVRPNVLLGQREGTDAATRDDDVERRYQQRLGQLVHELRVSAGATCALYALAAFLCARRRRPADPLLMPTLLLASTAGLGAAMFLLKRDWFWALLTGQYFVASYVAFLGLISALLLDIAFNRARICSSIARIFWHWPV
jgi:hypothetical protein